MCLAGWFARWFSADIGGPLMAPEFIESNLSDQLVHAAVSRQAFFQRSRAGLPWLAWVALCCSAMISGGPSILWMQLDV